MATEGWCDMLSARGTELVGMLVSTTADTCTTPKACLHYNVHIFHVPQTVLLAKANDSIIIRNSTSPGNRMCLINVPQQNSHSVTFRTAPKAVRKNSENMSSRIHK